VADRGTEGMTEDLTRLPLMNTSMFRWNTVMDTENHVCKGMFSTAVTNIVPFAEDPFAAPGWAAAPELDA
jgi:hypothetical protein